MAVKISRLFKDSKFKELPDKTKLLYIYLATNSDLNTVGVFSPNLEVMCIEVGCTMNELKESSTKLVKLKYVYVKKFEDIIYFIIPEHFSTIPKSEATISKVNKTLASLPKGLYLFLDGIGINVKAKTKVFIKPTVEEVSEYSLSLGYLVDSKEFINYYDEQSDRYGKKGIWVDGRGTQVRDWKAKLRKIWCKDDRKIKTFKEAPKGFQSFYIVKEGNIITPDGWKNDKPFSKSFTVDIELKREYEKRKASSK
jgi:hypothetical protein